MIVVTVVLDQQRGMRPEVTSEDHLTSIVGALLVVHNTGGISQGTGQTNSQKILNGFFLMMC
jgi:hypothetical protein